MNATTKPSRAQVRAHRRYEQRARLNGQGRIAARLSRRPWQLMQDLCARHECSPRDVIEGLLLGTIRTTAHPLGLSESELAAARELGVPL